jgi:hypothetical protein
MQLKRAQVVPLSIAANESYNYILLNVTLLCVFQINVIAPGRELSLPPDLVPTSLVSTALIIKIFFCFFAKHAILEESSSMGLYSCVLGVFVVASLDEDERYDCDGKTDHQDVESLIRTNVIKHFMAVIYGML